ncbi:MAG: hypothetical protein J6Y33_07770 [Prevotella sp.]|nr:hypothetical protein [Prevotella sp.]
MKKLFLFAAAAAMFAACSETDVLERNIQQNAANDGAVKFDVYAQRGLTRGGGQRGDLTNANIGENGFGVFAYYTAGDNYSTKAEPNFMFNQQVTCDGEATEGTIWKYEPVKYWPNEFGDAAISDDVDYVSFFAYAPWTDFDPATGDIVTTEPEGDGDESVEHQQKYNIISIGKNNMNGDPIVKYVVDTDPATSVDLLWGVAAEKANEAYTPINGNGGSSATNAGVKAKQGLPFIDMIKPNNPSQDRLMFNLKHALAKVKITIDYIKDATTPTGDKVDPVPDWMSDAYDGDEINADETRIYVRKFSITGWANEGALNLNNTTPGEPLWKDIDGQKDLSFSDEGVSFFDLRKDNGKEGTSGGEAKSEGIGGLNPSIIENFAETEVDETTGKTKFGVDKNPGVPKFGEEVLLFGGDADANKGFFYIIPRNDDSEGVNVTIQYDVETIDDALKGKLSDDKTHGSSIENIITKNDIFNGIDFKAGYQYEIKIHLGMTSVKIEATVQPWVENEPTEVDLPDNQDPTVDLEDEDLDNKPFVLAGTVYNLKYAYKDADDVEQEVDVVFTTSDPAEFIGGFVKGSVEAITVDGETILEAGDYYIPATAKSGDVVELLTFEEAPSRFTRGDGDDDGDTSAPAFKRTGIFVKIEAIEAPGEEEDDNDGQQNGEEV